MTHSDIYTKFMIAYDKENITSSYPSFTKYEIQTMLDTAYLALIAQKITGNNPRKVPFEYDIKAISDVQGLIKRQSLVINTEEIPTCSNEIIFSLPNDFLYYVNGSVVVGDKTSIDNKEHTISNVKLLPHNIASKFKNTYNNLPWVSEPVVYIDNNNVRLLYDSINHNPHGFISEYVKLPNKFVNSNDDSIFELSDSMIEELIHLTIIFATKSVESPKLNTEIQTTNLQS